MAQSKPLNILAFDGGGIRGLSSLLILDKIMERVGLQLGRDTSPAPCEFFDLICGTGTGGIIALMLGRLGMTAEECIKSYEELTKTVFRKTGADGLYDHKVLEEFMMKLAKQKDKSSSMLIDPKSKCKTFVVAVVDGAGDQDPKLFRTYSQDEESADRCKIWEAARATSAIPQLFQPITVDNVTYVDGSLGTHNNPSNLVRDEIQRIWPGRKVGLHLSIGTGNQRIVQQNTGSTIQQACEKLVSSCETTANAVYKRYRTEYGRPKSPYHRFSVDRGLENMYLNEWDRISELTGVTGGYLRGPDESVEIGVVVNILKQRAEDDKELL